MKALRSIVFCVILGVVIVTFAPPAAAIPVFARKYGAQCTLCHVQFPKLNDFGLLYRDNGYRMMGKEAEEQTAFDTPTPLALRTSFGYNHDTIRNPGGPEDSVRSFQVNGVDLLSGGLFTEKAGYIGVYLPEIRASRGVVGQDGTVEMANVVYTFKDAPLPMTLRVGRFEPAYVPFSAKRTFTVAPYAIYDFTGPDGLPLGKTQTGIEAAGVLPGKLRLAAGWVNGSDTDSASDSPQGLYMRASKVFGPGEGQVLGQRLGVFGYSGRSRAELWEHGSSDRKSIRRLGADLSLNFGQTNVMALYVKGRDNKALNVFDPGRDYDMSGGFVEVNSALPENVIGFARWDWVNTPSEQDQDERGWAVGVRYYPAMNTALHMEYARRTTDHGAENGISRLEERFWTARVDIAF